MKQGYRAIQDFVDVREYWPTRQLGGIALDGVGNIFISDSSTHQIKVFDCAGNHLRSFGKPGTLPGMSTNLPVLPLFLRLLLGA